jgi:uncharacterized phage protein (TIGR01671 family)
MKEQRVIKFRAWDIQNERMVYEPDCFEPSFVDEAAIAPYIFYETWQDREDGIRRPCYIMQFTGLLDKEGNEIYEGDIRREEIENDDGDEVYYCVMTYITEWSMFAWLSVTHGEYDAYLSKGADVLDTVMYWSYPAGQEDQNKVTVCGNIHQHKTPH